jgi:hypothetical protein
MAPLVYLLCSVSSLACALLLVKSYRQTRSRFLLQSSLCFTGLALSNVLLFVDMVVVPQVDFLVYRQLLTFISVTVLAWGFIWDTR